MTEKEIKSINLEKENDPKKLIEVIKYWQDKAVMAQYQLFIIQGNLSIEQLKSSINIEKVKELMNEKQQ